MSAPQTLEWPTAVAEPIDLLAPPAEPLGTPPPPLLPSAISRAIYLSLALLPIVLGSVVALSRAGILTTQPEGGRTPWDLAAMVVCAALVFMAGALVAQRAPRLVQRSHTQDAFDQAATKWELRILVGSLAPSILLLVLAFLAWSGTLRALGAWQLDALSPPLLAAAAVLLSCAPIGYFAYSRERRVHQMEERFPDFLRDVNESHGAGLTMAQAIRVAARGDYGKLNPEIRRMAHQVSWGTPFPDALRMFADRVGTPIVTRSVALIIKATRAGGNVKDVLTAASRDAREIKGLHQERRLSMTLYVIVIYVAFGVFLGVVAALQGLLVPALLQSTGSASGSVGGLAVGSATFDDFRLIYFSVGIVQALGSGIVAGIMAEGSLAAGLKHTTVLLLASVLVLGFLL